MSITNQELVNHLNSVYPKFDFFYSEPMQCVCYRNDMPDYVMLAICGLYHLSNITQVHSLTGVAKLIDDCFDPVRMN